MIALAIGVLRGYMPSLGYLEKWSIFPGDGVLEKFILFVLNATLIHLYMYVTRFVLQVILDYRRKIYIMKCLKSLISPHKVYKKKFFPTLNLLDRTSANSWYMMRRTLQNYGYNMDMRHKLLIPALFFYMLFIYALNWIKNLGLVQLEKNFISRLAPFLNIDYTLFSWLVLVLLFELAGLNMQDQYHIVSLQQIKETFGQIISHQKHFVKTGTEKISMLTFERENIFDKQLSNDMVKTYIRCLKEVCPPSQYTDYLKVISKLWTSITSNIEKERLNNYIQILTMNANRAFVLRMAFAVVFSLLGGIKFWM
jgi:hypothetical protein